MTKIGYYPGCSLLGSSREYDESLRAIMPHLDAELVEVPDWNCCGASSGHALNRELSLSLPARILLLAESAGITDMLVPCAACYNRLAMAIHELNDDPKLRERVLEITGLPYKGSIRPLNILEFLVPHMDSIKAKTAQPFDRAVACYYGCLLVRPPSVLKFDQCEDPRSMDNLMAAIGARPLDWAFKVECCGAGLSIARTDLVGKLAGKVVGNAVKSGAEAIVVACPMCHSNLDMRRSHIDKYSGTENKIPVIYITQAIGLALGIREKALGLKRHLVKVRFASKPMEKVQSQVPAGPVSASSEEA